MRRARQRGTVGPHVVYRSVLHIGEEWVRALVVEVRPESVLVIGAGKERRIDTGPALHATTLAPVCDDALRRAEDMTERTIGQLVVPDEAIIGVPGVFVYGVHGRVHVLRPQPEREISERELARLLSRLLNATEQLAAARTAEGQGAPPSLEMLTAKMSDLRVDAYEVTSPLRFRGANLEAAAVALYAESSCLNELRLLTNYLELAPQAVASSWALACCLPGQEALGLVLDSHETTLCLVRQGAVVALDRCGYGTEEMIRELSVALGLPRFRTEALRNAYARGELDETVGDWVREGILYSARQWLQPVGHVLRRILEGRPPGMPLPDRLCFCELGTACPLLEPLLTAWMESWLPPDRFPTLERLRPQDIRISERTGLIGQEAGDAEALALAHYAGILQQPLHPMDALLHHLAAGQETGARNL